jgi:alanyl-tRNA synthetase
LSVGRDEALEAVARLLEEHKKLERRARVLAERAMQAETQELLAATPVTPTPRIIMRIFDDRDFDDVKLLAHRLVADHGVMALLATRTHDLVRLVCARSADLLVAANALLQPVCDQLGGRSGGKPEFAQGSGTRVTELECALTRAVASLKG